VRQVNRTIGIKPRLTTLAAVAATSALLWVPAASADTPVGPGGCNMLTPDFTESPVGTGPMMAGSSVTGTDNMIEVLEKFRPDVAFCGAYG